jgi:hypothetical protein
MSFINWLLNYKTLIGVLVLLVRHKIIKEKSIRTFALASASNLIMLSAAENLGYINTGFIASIMALVASVLLGLAVLRQLAKRRHNKDYNTASKDEGQVYEPLHVLNKYQDLRVPLTDVLFIFSAQTMLIVLYMQDLWAPLHTGLFPSASFYAHFNVGLYACGWVAQGLAYAKFGFHLSDDIDYWTKIAGMRAVAIQYGDRVSGLSIVDTEQPSVIGVDWRVAAFRGALSFIVYQVYDIYLWMTLPLYIGRGFGGVQLLTHVVIIVYVMTLGDVSRPAVLHERSGDDVESGEDNRMPQTTFPRNNGPMPNNVLDGAMSNDDEDAKKPLNS